MLLSKIHSDDRGSVRIITGKEIGHPEISILTAKKGYARGGCVHDKSDEYMVVVSGSVIYQIGDKTHRFKVGDSCIIPKGTPHYFVALEDSVVLEWGATLEEKLKKHKAFRKIVDKINDTTSGADIRRK